MVVTPEEGATRAGIEALQAGGNAVDAAVAAAFALGVTQPQSTGIGGGAFVLLRLADGQTFAVDARETAPARATAEMFAAPEALPGEKVAGGWRRARAVAWPWGASPRARRAWWPGSP
jgi:gamma-glutamyltranspeptidase/glutathione hydrolase